MQCRREMLRGAAARSMLRLDERDVKVDDAAVLVREDDGNIEDAKGEGGDGEEIEGSKLLGVVVENCFPGRKL